MKGSALSTGYSFVRRVVRSLVPDRVRRALRRRSLTPSAVDAVRHLPLKDKFSEVYVKNLFGGDASRSGPGSDLRQTEAIRREIPRLLNKYEINSILDAPCGDWYWMREVDLGIQSYTGADIVQAMINRNNENYGNDKTKFVCRDLSTDALPHADLIFSRDCLVHLSFEDAIRIIENFKNSGAKYLLTTTFTDRVSNKDLGGDFWRPLNKRLAPFNFPPPLELIDEECTEDSGIFRDKSLGLWKMEDIEVATALPAPAQT